MAKKLLLISAVRWLLPVFFGDRIGTTECLTRQMSLSVMEANRIVSENGTKAGVPALPLLVVRFWISHGGLQISFQLWEGGY